MTIEISDSLRDEIEAFFGNYDSEIAVLKDAAKRSQEAHGRISDTAAEIASFPTIETLDDKGIQKRLIASERKRLLEHFIVQIDEAVENYKRKVSRLAQDAGEFFRRAAGKTLEQATRDELIDSLPDSLRRDAGMINDIWSRSAARREMALFLNPGVVDPHAAAESIVAEAERRASLLRDLLDGRDIKVLQTADAVA